jgi:5-methyltetrahydropteroyltriglutamate--homocysteine methyltransferase
MRPILESPVPANTVQIYRADHVGSLLRPKRLLDARTQCAAGSLTHPQLREIENASVKEATALQESVGLHVATDGEFRRGYFQKDFLEQIGGVGLAPGLVEMTFRRADGTVESERPPVFVTKEKLQHTHSIQGEDFDFLKGATRHTAKVCIPSPSLLHFRGGRKVVSEQAYPDMDVFLADLARVYNEEILDLAARGCRYVQLDETNLAYLCDPKFRTMVQERGEDPDTLVHTYAKLINESIKNRPRDMIINVHLCRGNHRSAWVAEGGYESVAEAMFAELNVNGFLLEYDDDRSGGFAPLRFVPKGKTIALGLISSKLAQLEAKDAIKRRIEAAAKVIPLEQLALSPQCGFASTSAGNLLSVDDQKAKLALAVQIAIELWGAASTPAA